MNDVIEAMDKLLEHYRHDFLNVLQVAGGLAQLHKTERLLAYISQASAEVQQFGHFISCGDSRFALIVLENLLQTLNGHYVLQVKGRMPLLSPDILQALPDTLTAVLDCLPKVNDYTVSLSLKGDEQPQLRLSLLEDLEIDWQQAQAAAERHDLQAGLDKVKGEFLLLLDKRDSTGEK